MSETLLLLIAKYAVKNTTQSMKSMSDYFSEHPDNYINYILRTALPSEYCFDGLKYTLTREELKNSIQLTSIFWYLLDEGKISTAALRFSAQIVNNKICYQYSIVPFESDLYESLDCLKWPEPSSGVI